MSCLRPRIIEKLYIFSWVSIVVWAGLNTAACDLGFDFNNPVEDLPRGTITGRLVSDTTTVRVMRGEQTPIAGGECTLEGTNTGATSDADGQFEMLDVPVGSYLLICRYQVNEGELAALVAVEVHDRAVVDLGTLTITPTGSISGVVHLANAQDHSGIAIAIPGTSMQGTSGADGRFALSGIPAGSFSLRFERVGYLPLQLSDIKVVSGQTTELGELTLNISTGPTGTLLIEGGAAVIGSREVGLTIAASTQTTIMVISESSDFANTPWEPIATSKRWTFAYDGQNRLFIKFGDGTQESTPISASIVVDTEPPSISGMAINGGIGKTPVTSVSVAVTAGDLATGATHLRLGNTPDLSMAEWQPMAAAVPWELLDGDGMKTVYAMVKDAMGHESAVASAQIDLDTSLPPEPFANVVETLAAERTVHVELFAFTSDSVWLSGEPSFVGVFPSSYQVGNMEIQPFTFAADVPDGVQTVYVRFTGEPSGETFDLSDTVMLDANPPTTPSLACDETPTSEHVVLNNGKIFTDQASVQVRVATPSTDVNFLGYSALQYEGYAYPRVGELQEASDGLVTVDLTSFINTNGGDVFVGGVDVSGHVSAPSNACQVCRDTFTPYAQVFSNTPSSTSVVLSVRGSSYSCSQDFVLWVDYGLTADYGSRTPDVTQSADSMGGTDVLIEGLTPGTHYFARLSVQNVLGAVGTATFDIMTLP